MLKKYTRFLYKKAVLSEAASKSVSISEVIRRLGLRWNGSRHAVVKAKLKQFCVSTSHFTGQITNAGNRHRGGPSKKPWQDVLILRDPSKPRELAFRLRRALLESGRPYHCEGENCKCASKWLEKELRLIVDHIDGRWNDSRPKNVRFLCPNCNSQTATFGMNFGGTSVTSNAKANRNRRLKRKFSKETL
jgi:hypothetical protein